MNKKRRNELQLVIDGLEGLNNQLQVIKEQEEEAFNNMPDSLQDSEKGEQMSDNVTELEKAFDLIQESINTIQEILDK